MDCNDVRVGEICDGFGFLVEVIAERLVRQFGRRFGILEYAIIILNIDPFGPVLFAGESWIIQKINEVITRPRVLGRMPPPREMATLPESTHQITGYADADE